MYVQGACFVVFRSLGQLSFVDFGSTFPCFVNGVGVSSRISGRSTPLRRTDFLARKFFDFDERLLLSTPSFSTEQLLETSESGDPDVLCSLSAQNPGA